ncbi:phytanoyl dioxygenase [Colletotrichum truncatum]|uniref:Phytanoyl dioxygenase n=1 Tax=Colletotrichum truncatum TaxID=5467 RepID=A0ACC3YHU3_COLTU|nr:phytanoyl dioxygenase [Colletotrichum truncatum]KAF6785993.1 phytanoyl dioxygenase [Colletotrichum truncatum]
MAAITLPPAEASLTPGLDFKGLTLSDPKGKEFESLASEVVEIIKDKLSILGKADTLAEFIVTDKLPRGQLTKTLFIDARPNGTRLLESLAEGAEVDVTIILRPDMLFSLANGSLDINMIARVGFNITGKTPPKAYDLLDLLGPKPSKVMDYAEYTFPDAELPKPTTDLSEVKRNIKRFGYAIVKNALNSEQVQIVRQAILEQASGERQAGVADIEGGTNQRLWNVINKGEEFVDLLNHPLFDELLSWFLGDYGYLTQASVNILGPNNIPMPFHRDQIPLNPFTDEPIGLSFMFYVEDCSKSNGATHVIPASHVGHVRPWDTNSFDGSIPAAAPAGSCLVFNTTLWHSTGVNTTSAERPALIYAFSRYFMSSTVNPYVSLRPEVLEKLTLRQRHLLGFVVRPAYNWVGKKRSPGEVLDKYGDDTGKIRAEYVPIGGKTSGIPSISERTI